MNLAVRSLLKFSSEIQSWVTSYGVDLLPPFYCSCDVRESHFKLASVDCNVFPAGFNNLCEEHLHQASVLIKKRFSRCYSAYSKVVLIVEDLTRNYAYWQNVFCLRKAFLWADIPCSIAVSDDRLSCCLDFLKTHGNFKNVDIYGLSDLLLAERDSLFVSNNDFTLGVPDNLIRHHVSVVPSFLLGWHQRRKSTHFRIFDHVVKKMCLDIQMDPWLISCYHSYVEGGDINDEVVRYQIADKVQIVLNHIQNKYDEYGIEDRPVVFIKSDSGTFGMGVIPIQSSEDVLTLNVKNRNKLLRGKMSSSIDKFFIQEGVPSIHQVNGQIGEVVSYFVDGVSVGSFMRLNKRKGPLDNLNSNGMFFMRMCEDSDYRSKNCLDYELMRHIWTQDRLTSYQLVGALSNMALSIEANQLPNQQLDSL